MKNIVEYINNFLNKKGIVWHNKAILDSTDGKLVKAADKDFSNNEMQTLRLINSEFESAVKQMLINENLFLVFDELGNKLEKDLSNEWKNHLATIAQQKDKNQLEEKFNNFKKDLEADNFDDITLKQEIREYLADKQNDTYNHNSFDDILE